MGGDCRASSQASRSLSNSVTIGLPLEQDTEQDYCFSVTASNGTFTAIVEGTFKTGIIFMPYNYYHMHCLFFW